MAKSVETEEVHVGTMIVAPSNAERLAAGAISFHEAMESGADVVIGGGNLWKDDDLDRMVGVPFAVMGGTFRNDKQREFQGIKMRGDYVTLECIVGDEEALTKARVDWENLGIQPLEEFLFNDGSTGVRRQMVSYLVAKGFIVLSDKAAEEYKTSGALGECDFDMPVQMWKDMSVGEVKASDDGYDVSWSFKLPRLLIAKRGIRISKYETDAYGDGRTRYLA